MTAPIVTDAGFGFMLGKAAATENAMKQWRDYATKLEKALQAQVEATHGHASIKEAALKEIARFDPNNPLLKDDVRKAIYERSILEAKKSGAIK